MSDSRIWLAKFHSDWQKNNISAAYFIVRFEFEFEFIGVLRHMQRYLSHICDGTDVQADWRRSCTYGLAPNAIDISQGSLTCLSYTDTGPPFLYGDSDLQDFQNQSKWLAFPKRFQHLWFLSNIKCEWIHGTGTMKAKDVLQLPCECRTDSELHIILLYHLKMLGPRWTVKYNDKHSSV